jgi:hypothetical protein
MIVSALCRIPQSNDVIFLKGNKDIRGHVLNKEEPIDAVIRLFMKKTGLGTGRKDWTQFVTIKDRNHTVLYYFADLESANLCRSMEEELIYLDILDLGRIAPDLRWIIPLAFSNSPYKWDHIIELETI